VAGHGPGVTEGEVDVAAPVDVVDPTPPSPVHGEREASGPLAHPRHGHAADKVTGLFVKGRRARVGVGVERFLGCDPIGQRCSINFAHGPWSFVSTPDPHDTRLDRDFRGSGR
jgi:hypothetical protein